MALPAAGWGAESAAAPAPAAGTGPKAAFSGLAAPAAPKFSAAQLAHVGDWLRAIAPAAPPAAVSAAAQHFLEDLQWQHPDEMDRLLTDASPEKDMTSALLGRLAAQLTAAPQAALREELARRRVEALLPPGTPAASVAALIEKMKGASQVYYQRLLAGRIDDEDLIPLLKDAQQAGTAAARPASSRPAELTAADILSEFSKHNQNGLALSHLRAYTVEGTLKLPGGAEQQLLLFKLRPDRFRLHVLAGGATHYILGYDGARFWQEAPNHPPEVMARESLGPRAYLAEFINPLFGDLENYNFTRLADGALDGGKVYRLEVRRPDGSKYVACIDPATFHEVGGEYDNGVRVRYSDFRQVSGLTLAFCEETTDREGHKDVFQLTRFTANPGLIQDFFEEPVPGRDLSYLSFERLVASAHPAPATGKD